MYPELIGESVRGEKHVRSDEPCQDNWNGVVTDKYLITSVADGLGSSEKSAVGSEVAVETAVSTFQEWASNNPKAIADGDTEAVQEAFGEVYSAARNEIKRVADENGSSVNEYHTTLSIVRSSRYIVT
jgi:serine/threonine protein phosphatase PrpC